jgi:uncharacterized protein
MVDVTPVRVPGRGLPGRAPVIDAHVHIGTGDGLTGPWDTCGSLATYLSRAGPAGITGAVLMPPLTSDYPRANDDLAPLIRRSCRFLGFAFVNPVTEAGQIRSRLTRAIRRDGFCGIKVHARDGRMTREVADTAGDLGVPVLYDPRGDTASVEMVARSYPQVAWIIPHLSSFADDWRAQSAFVDQLCRLPNVFTDTSGVRYFDLLQDAVRRAGPDKILFGSDGPFLHPAVELAKVRALGLPPADEALVTGGNLLRLVGPVLRRSRPSPRPPGHPRSALHQPQRS